MQEKLTKSDNGEKEEKWKREAMIAASRNAQRRPRELGLQSVTIPIKWREEAPIGQREWSEANEDDRPATMRRRESSPPENHQTPRSTHHGWRSTPPYVVL